MKAQPAFLVLRGSYTQRQFDAIGRFWDNFQRGTTDTLPIFQLPNEGNIGLVKIEDTGEIVMETLFDDIRK